MLWTHPSDGAIDVPTNTQLLVTGESYGAPSLNGVRLAPGASGVFSLGELEPHTLYQVTWDESVPASEAFSFTTGGGPSMAPAPDISSSVEVTRNPAREGVHCPLVTSEGCFDTGPPARVLFDAGAAPVAWIVESLSCEGFVRQRVWPAQCGLPLLEREDRIVCARLQASDGVHLSAATELICSAPQLAANVSLARSSGCIGAWPPEAALTLTSRDGVACSSANASCDAATPAAPSVSSAPTDVVTRSSSNGCSSARDSSPEGSGSAWLAGALLT